MNEIPKQVPIVKQLKHLIVIDGCRNSCAKKTAERLSLSYDGSLNLKEDLAIKKQGPFSTLEYTSDQVKGVKTAIQEKINSVL